MLSIFLKVPHRRRIQCVKKSESLTSNLSKSEDSVNPVWTYISMLDPTKRQYFIPIEFCAETTIEGIWNRRNIKSVNEITDHLCKKELAYEDGHILEWKPVWPCRCMATSLRKLFPTRLGSKRQLPQNVCILQTTWRHIPDNCGLNIHHSESKKFKLSNSLQKLLLVGHSICVPK